MDKKLPAIVELDDSCCGCGACAAKCPKCCITMEKDAVGFLHPSVNASACVGCGACTSACPAINDRPKDDCEAVYWAKSNNEPEKLASSSGGVFALLAHDVLAAGGAVCGAAWTQDFKGVHHVLVEDETELASVMRSKYVQSAIDAEVYEGVRNALRDGRRVLFTGTACQVSGMRGYLGKLAESENLLLVDVICHGTPSPLLWEKWATWREEEADAKLCEVNMRSKETGWLSFSAVYTYSGKEYDSEISDGGLFSDDWYFKAFLNNASLRMSCYRCPVKRSCGSDITLGDFWEIQTTHPEVDYVGGASAVLCNTPKGLEAITAVGSCMQSGESSFDKIAFGNPSLLNPVAPYEKRDAFVADLAGDVEIESLITKYSFTPSLKQRIRGKLSGMKRRMLG